MNDKNFDSFIKQSLDGHSSTVPADMWKRVQAEKDFDPFVQQKLNNHSSAVPANMWDRITSEKDLDADVKQKLADFISPVPAEMWQRIQNEKDFDATLKGKLDNYSSSVPANMWQRIRPEEEKKRRPIIWWWAAAASLLLLAGIGASLFIKHNQSPIVITKNNIAPLANDSQSVNSITLLPNGAGGSVTPSQGHDSLTIPNVNNTVPKTDPFTSNNSSSNHSNSASAQNKHSTQHNFPNNQTSNEERLTTNSTNQAINSTQNNKSNSANSLETINKNWQNKKYTTGNNLLSGSSSVVANGTIENPDDQLLLNSNTLSSSEKQLMLKNLIRSSLDNNKMSVKQLLHANAKMPSIICPTLGPPSRNDWYVEAFVSPDFVVKNLQDKPASTNIKSGMDSTLHRQVSFSAGINVVKNIGENLLVKTGVQYSQVNELFKYNSGSDTRTTTVITVRDVIVSPGDTIHIRDTSTVTQTGTIAKQTQNRYKQWDIPLIFGYEFGGEGLRLNANVGVIANIRSSYQGNMLDTAQKVIDIASYNNTGIYKTSIGLGIYLGLGILKPLNENMDLLVEPHARFNLANMTTQAAIFNQKNSIFGLSVGIRYKLNSGRQRY